MNMDEFTILNEERKERFEKRLKKTTTVLKALGIFCVASPILHLIFQNSATLTLMGVSGLIVVAVIFFFLLGIFAVLKESGILDVVRFVAFGVVYKIGNLFAKLFERKSD